MKAVIAEYRNIRQPRNVGLISVSHGINEFYGLVIPPIIPLLITDLDITYAAAGLLLTVFYAMYSIFQLPAGMIADRIGKKRLLVAGLFGMALGLVIASRAESYELLLLAKVLMGIAGSTYHPAGMAMVSDGESKETEGKAMGVFGLGGQIGVASAPIIIGGIAAIAHWRTALFFAAGVGIVFTIAFHFLYRIPHTSIHPHENAGKRTDGGADRSDERSSIFSVRSWIQQTLRIEITLGLLLISFVTLLVSLQIRSIQTFATGFVADGTGQTTAMANVVFFVMLAASAISSIWVGSLADRFDRGKLGVIAASLTTLLLLTTFIVASLGTAVGELMITGILIVVFGLLGLALYGCTPIKNALISEYATTDTSGSIFGVTQTAGSAGSAAGPAIFGYIATEFSITVAFPLIAVVGLVIAVSFVGISRRT